MTFVSFHNLEYLSLNYNELNQIFESHKSKTTFIEPQQVELSQSENVCSIKES